MSGIERAIELSGGVTRMARQLGVSKQVVANWKARGVPAEACPLIERVTNRAVRCEELRPDVDWAYLRHSSKSKAPQ